MLLLTKELLDAEDIGKLLPRLELASMVASPGKMITRIF